MPSFPNAVHTDLLCFATSRWHWMPQAMRDELCRASLVRRVIVVEEPVFMPGAPSMDVELPVEKLVVARPCLPYPVVDGGIARVQRALLDSWIAERAVRPGILWYQSPAAVAYSAHLTAHMTVYDCIDRAASAASLAHDFARLEHALMERADVVLAESDTSRHALRLLHPNVRLARSTDRRSVVDDIIRALSRHRYQAPALAIQR